MRRAACLPNSCSGVCSLRWSVKLPHSGWHHAQLIGISSHPALPSPSPPAPQPRPAPDLWCGSHCGCEHPGGAWCLLCRPAGRVLQLPGRAVEGERQCCWCVGKCCLGPLQQVSRAEPLTAVRGPALCTSTKQIYTWADPNLYHTTPFRIHPTPHPAGWHGLCCAAPGAGAGPALCHCSLPRARLQVGWVDSFVQASCQHSLQPCFVLAPSLATSLSARGDMASPSGPALTHQPSYTCCAQVLAGVAGGAAGRQWVQG